MTIKDRLAGMEDVWGSTSGPDAPSAFDKLPAGDHTVKLAKSEVFETSAGKLVWLLVFEDEHSRQVEKWHNLDRPESVPYIKSDALSFGYSGSYAGLGDWAGSIVGSMCRVKVKYKQGQGGTEFASVYVNEVTDLVKGDVKPAAPAPSDADDIPF